MVTVWTKQNAVVADTLEKTGRYTAKKEFVVPDGGSLVTEVYDWLVQNSPRAQSRPADADYPVWVSFRHDTTMLPEKNTVILQLNVDEKQLTRINIAKWSMMLNYSYIPLNEKDALRHRQELAAYGVSDAKAYMTQFYPQLRREIRDSWQRLFDESICPVNDLCYGNLWEVKKEWVTDILR